VAKLLGLYPPRESRVRVAATGDRALEELTDEELVGR
jgi:hypothetical protein